jgi:hypothetical protein
MAMESEWEQKLPGAPGLYWFYGYRYRGSETPVLKLLEVRKIRNGYSYVMDGNFLFESEMSHNFFCTPATPPELPELEEKKPAVGAAHV